MMRRIFAKWFVLMILPVCLLGCAPRPQSVQPNQELADRILDSLAEVDFPIRLPNWLPDGYSFDSLSLRRNFLGKVDQVWLQFARSPDRSITIMLWPPSGQGAKAQTEAVAVGSYTAQYEEQPRPNGAMLRIVDLPMEDVRAFISSNHLSRAGILRIAESMTQP